MITLTAPIPVPNITRISCESYSPNHRVSRAVLEFDVMSPAAGNRKLVFEVRVSNGACQTLIKSATPTKFDGDVVYGPEVNIPTAFDQIETAYAGGATKAARLRAVEQKCLDLLILGAGLAGTVG